MEPSRAGRRRRMPASCQRRDFAGASPSRPPIWARRYRLTSFIVASTKAATIMVRASAVSAACARTAGKPGGMLRSIRSPSRQPIAIVFTRPCSMRRCISCSSCCAWRTGSNSICRSGSIASRSAEPSALKPIAWSATPIGSTACLGADIFIYDQSHNPIAVLQGCRCRAHRGELRQKLSHPGARLGIGSQSPRRRRAPAIIVAIVRFQRDDMQELARQVGDDCLRRFRATPRRP